MPVTVESGVAGPFTPNGVTTSFPFGFKADSASEVIVVDQDDVELSAALYSVTLNSGEGGTVTFTSAPEAADYDALYIVSDPAMTTTADFGNTGPSFNPASLTRAIDRAAVRDIALKTQIDRAIKMPFSGGTVTLPDDVAGKFLSFDAERNVIGSEGTGADSGLRTDLAASTGAALVGLGQASLATLLPFTPERYGAVGDGVTDDSEALIAMAAAVNLAGGGRIVFAAGKTYLLSHVDEATIAFANISGIRIEGEGATLKTPDNGAPTDTASSGTNWGQINFDRCSNIAVLGLTFDGNRAGQLHTSGEPNGTGFNAGISFWTASTTEASEHILIEGCTFKNHGVLSGTVDARGDGIYAQSGTSHIRVLNNHFESPGRWAIAVADGQQGSSHVYIRGNTGDLGERGSGGYIPWGSIDLEDVGFDHEHIYIENNQFTGTAVMSVGGFGVDPVECTITDLHIRGNRLHLPDAQGAADVPFNIGNSNPGVSTYRTLRRLFVEDNIVTWAGLPSTFNIGHTARLVDAFIRGNTFYAETATLESDNGLQIGFSGHLEGQIEVSGNTFIGLGEAIKNADSWYADPSPNVLRLRIENNRFHDVYRAFNLNFASASLDSGSTLDIAGNVSRNSRAIPDGGAGELIDGGTHGVTLCDLSGHDGVGTHTNVTYGASKPLEPCLFAELPGASAALRGIRGSVTDANATTFGSTVAGGGSNVVPVFCTGAAWIIG